MSLLILVLAGCGAEIGTPCEQTEGMFGLSDPCSSQCLGLWTMTCPGDREIKPAICAGTHGCTPGSCPEGQLCYAYPDPFEDQTYCVPDDVCGPLDPAAGAAWETSAAAAWKAQQEKFGKKKPGSKTTTAPASP